MLLQMLAFHDAVFQQLERIISTGAAMADPCHVLQQPGRVHRHNHKTMLLLLLLLLHIAIAIALLEGTSNNVYTYIYVVFRSTYTRLGARSGRVVVLGNVAHALYR